MGHSRVVLRTTRRLRRRSTRELVAHARRLRFGLPRRGVDGSALGQSDHGGRHRLRSSRDLSVRVTGRLDDEHARRRTPGPSAIGARRPPVAERGTVSGPLLRRRGLARLWVVPSQVVAVDRRLLATWGPQRWKKTRLSAFGLGGFTKKSWKGAPTTRSSAPPKPPSSWPAATLKPKRESGRESRSTLPRLRGMA